MRPRPVTRIGQSIRLQLPDTGEGGEETYHCRVETLRILDVDGLNVRKQSVLCSLFVVTLARDTDTKSVRNTLDSLLPDLLVQLRVETDVLGTLFSRSVSQRSIFHSSSSSTVFSAVSCR